jgi:hypothetical protein
MRQTSNLRLLCGLFCAALIVSIAFGPGGGAAFASEPAKVVTLSGDMAAILRTLFKPSVPVLVTGAGEEVVAIVFDEDPDEAARLSGELFTTEPVEGCVGEGQALACCDTTNGTMVLSATYEDQSGWVQMGELCTVPGLEAVDYIPVPEEVTRKLNESFGVDDCFMELAGEGGVPLVLVNAPSEDNPLWPWCFSLLADAEGTSPTFAGAPTQGALWLASSIARRAVLRPNPSIIPAKHVTDPPPPPRCRSSRPPGCDSESYKICSDEVAHWYKKNSEGDWCYKSTECGPC